MYIHSDLKMENNLEDDILRPLTESEFSELLDLYREKYDADGFQYLLLYTQHQWNKQLRELNIHEEDNKWISFRKIFYTHRNTDFRKFGTYVCLHQDLIQSVSFHTWEPNCCDLLECLNKTNLIFWQNRPLLVSVADAYSADVKKMALTKAIGITPRQCQGFILKKAKALQLETPSLPLGYKQIALQEQHADLVYSLWANKKEASLNYIKGFIKLGRCIAVMDQSTQQLAGWIFQNEFSGLGILQVIPSAQRKGLGVYLAIAMSKLIAENYDVQSSAFVVVGNIKSESLLKKIGYERMAINEWIQLEAPDKN